MLILHTKKSFRFEFVYLHKERENLLLSSRRMHANIKPLKFVIESKFICKSIHSTWLLDTDAHLS